MRRTLLTLALVLVAAVAASAQTYWSMTQWFQHTIATQAARLDLTANDPAAPVRGYLDSAWVTQNPSTWESELHLVGWGFECGQIGLDALDVRLNAFVREASTLVTYGPRGDVIADPGLSGWCASIPLYNGLAVTVPLGSMHGGTYAVALRLWTSTGAHWTTNWVWVTIP